MHSLDQTQTPAARGGRRAGELALLAFLTRYSGNTLTTYRAVITMFHRWAAGHDLDVLELNRGQLEMFFRWCETERGVRPSTVAQYIGIVQTFYGIAVTDGYLVHNPADRLRRPKFYRDESRLMGLDRFELAALLVASRQASPCEGALVTLMGVAGLRISEACAVRIEHYGDIHRGHRVLRVTGKGNRAASIPLPISVLRTLDAAAGDRTSGPLLIRPWNNRPMNPEASLRIVRRLAKEVGINKPIGNHTFRHTMITNALDAGVPLRDVQVAARHADPRMTALYDRYRNSDDRHAIHTLSAYLAGPS